MKKNLKCKTGLLLFSLFLFVPLFMYATAQNDVAISLDFTNVPLGKVLNEISKSELSEIILCYDKFTEKHKCSIYSER